MEMTKNQTFSNFNPMNRNEFPVEGVMMKTKYHREIRYFDLVKGELPVFSR
jgi:hypothetical protein